MILAGDVGGTKVHLALYDFAEGNLHAIRDEKFPAHQFGSLDEIVNKFLSGNEQFPAAKREEILAACFGCPGPVRDGRLKLTNLPWVLDARDLSKSLSIKHVFLINDLEANGYGIPELAADKIFTLHEGDANAVGHRGLIAAGTGLGQALLIWDGKRHNPIPSEGGHCDFAARSNREIAMLEYLRGTLKGRVSFERVVSGLGIKNVYRFLREVEKLDEPKWLCDRMAGEDPNAVIGECAEDGSSSICFETMKLFASAYGAEAGNLALKVLATGGIYLGGGIAPKRLKTMQNGFFMQAFLDKGRMSPLLQSIPVRIILDDSCALLGAAAYGEARAAEMGDVSERAASVKS
ncbi:MAG: glucokinase [Edaphobacter sp.]|uniref:glucokinase n=1 Tax=Edaphobacter sp. TaxID=1934404 RepID=UPI00238584F5|nr:glucokinase [Edaphobacter sp.]MDE1176576.1 glucokinase [Edaphobacter sp.]